MKLQVPNFRFFSLLWLSLFMWTGSVQYAAAALPCDLKVQIKEGNSIDFDDSGGILHASATSADAVFEWLDANGITIDVTADVKVERTGVYTVIARIGEDCVARASIQVNVVIPQGEVVIMEGSSVEFTYQGTLTAATQANDLQLEWRKNNFKVGSGKTLTVRESGLYTVYLRTAKGTVISSSACRVEVRPRVYSVLIGDDLARISRKFYGDDSKIDLIRQANPNVVGIAEDVLIVGTRLIIPNDASINNAADVTIRLVGNAFFPPFSDPSSYNGGMVREIVETVFKEMGNPVTVEYLEQGVAKGATFSGAYTAMFPFIKNANDEQSLLFSAPLYKELTVFFVRKNTNIIFDKPKDLKGQTVGITRGYEIAALKDYFEKGYVNLRPCRTIEECFELLKAGKIDMVATSQMLGWSMIGKMGSAELQNFKALSTPIETNSLHLVISINHPNGKQLISDFDAKFNQLTQQGKIREIQNKHIDRLQISN